MFSLAPGERGTVAYEDDAEERDIARSWPAAGRKLYDAEVARQEALLVGLTLKDLDAKVARQAELCAQQRFNLTPGLTPEGELSLGAKLHATLAALRRLQAAESREEHDGLKRQSDMWLQSVRGTLALLRLCATSGKGCFSLTRQRRTLLPLAARTCLPLLALDATGCLLARRRRRRTSGPRPRLRKTLLPPTPRALTRLTHW